MEAMPFELAIALRPTLVNQTALTGCLLTAHLMVFWLSQDSNVTPPVCLAAFTAAGIAGAKPMATGVEAWKISKGLYIVPLMFAYTPLVTGDLTLILQIGAFALFGIYALNAIMQRYAEGPLAWWSYAVLVLGAGGAFFSGEWTLNIAGAVLVIFVLITSKKAQRATN